MTRRVFTLSTAAGRLGLSLLMAAALAGLAGCGPSGSPSSSASGAKSFLDGFHQGFDKSFNDAFAKSVHDSCVSAATAHNATADQAERYCGCIVTQLAPLSVDEKRHFDPNSAKGSQIREYCRTQSQ
jgi:hypothetical protein